MHKLTQDIAVDIGLDLNDSLTHILMGEEYGV
jgi:hypothetical protein